MEINEDMTTKLPVNSTNINRANIKPGEIWVLTGQIQSPLALNAEEQKRLYPQVAWTWQFGSSNLPTLPPRYVMIVQAPEADTSLENTEKDPPLAPPSKGGDTDDEWQEVSVMLLSVECDRLSNVDIVIPAKISGLEQDLLAETWHVLPMLTVHLSHPVGQRLSRQIYDLLLDIGDAYHGLIDQPPARLEIEKNGLKIGTKLAESDPEIQAFHQQERDWAAVLEVPVAAARACQKALEVSEDLVAIAIEIEREFSSHQKAPVSPIVNLSKWLENTAETIQQGWQLLDELMQPKTLGFAFRRSPQKAAGEVRRGKLIKFWHQGEEETFILTVSLQKTNEKVDIILRLYPMEGRNYLPAMMQMSVLDELGNSLLDATAKSSDEFIQIKLDGLTGEQFGVQVNFGQQIVTEKFVI